MMWPDNADGDVLRRMESKGFDFRKPHEIEFNVDFNSWPPAKEAIDALKREYPSVLIYPQMDSDPGYVQFRLFGLVSYNLVTKTQTFASDLMRPFGGVCESWGVLH